MKYPGTRLGFYLQQERGGVLVLVAVAMVALLGMAAIAVDVGNLYHTRRQMVNAADAAALAGIQELLDSDKTHSDVKGKAVLYAGYNGADITVHEVEVIETASQRRVVVDVDKDVDYFFAGIFRMFDANSPTEGSVPARAVAAIGYPTSVTNIKYGNFFPIIMDKQAYDDAEGANTNGSVVASLMSDDKHVVIEGATVPGNWGIIQIPGPGNNNKNVEGAVKGTLETDALIVAKEWYDYNGGSDTGNFPKLDEWVQARLDNDDISNFVLIPIVSEVAKPGKTELYIEGFAVYEITGTLSGQGNEFEIIGKLHFDIPIDDFAGGWTEDTTYDYGGLVFGLVE